MIGGEKLEFTADDPLFEQQPASGLSIESECGFIVGVSTALTPGLKREGAAREFVHSVQALRKEAGFDISDFINLSVEGSSEMENVVSEFEGYIKKETLAVDITVGSSIEGFLKEQDLDGGAVKIAVVKR